MWSREALATAVRTRAFWIRYGLCLVQVLVIVAYFLPWGRTYAGNPYPPSGLLEWMYSAFTHDPTTHETFFIASLLTCLVAAVISLVMVVIALTKSREHASALRVSSMFSSFAVVGPLLYLHRYLPWPLGSGDLSHLWPLITEMSIGWYIALSSGSATCVLALILCHDACKAPEGGTVKGRGASFRVQSTTFVLACLLVVVAGCVTAVIGFLMTWSSGSVYGLGGGDEYWSNEGLQVSPVMHIVPIAAVLSIGLTMLSLSIIRMRNKVFAQVAENLMILTLALTLFWGPAFGDFDPVGIDQVWVGRLQLGWYLCVIGQSAILVFMFLLDRFWYVASSDNRALRLDGVSRLL